ncbi:MAG: hypothetical protein ACTS5Y_08090 [Pollutimonas bauzanensis]
MQTLTIRGSYGSLIVNAVTGTVLGYDTEGTDNTEYADIVRFDLDEYRAWAAEHAPRVLNWDEGDIVGISFWTDTGEYVNNARAERMIWSKQHASG